MVSKEIKKAIETLKKADYKYIEKVLKREKSKISYDFDYCGWTIQGEYGVDFLYENESTYLNPKELESAIDEIIEDEIFPIEETASDFISYFEAKYGLEDITEDRISSNILRDAEFHIFEHMGLSDEVIKQLSTGINYYFEEQQIEYWRNEMSNIIRKEYLPLTLEEIESKKEKFKNKDFNIYINRAYKSTCSIEELKEMMKNEI